jgi:Zn-dependent M28 family amino/carboxypeptidase
VNSAVPHQVWMCRRGATLERSAVARRTDIAAVERDAATAALLDELSAQRYQEHLADLLRPATRHSLSSGYREAQGAAETRLQTAGFMVSRVPVTVGDGTCDTLVADKPGGAAQRGLVLVTAHLDSINHRGGPAAPAPGADDNASGSAGALELAAVLAAHDWRNDLRVILFGGEEEGLLGSLAYVAALPAAERARTAAVLNMDMIGRRNGARPGVMLEGAPVSQRLIDDLATAAATWTDLEVSTSLHPFASDHVPFIDAGIPAVLTIEADDAANTDVHTAGDTADRLDVALAMQILRMNLAVLATALGTQAATA